MVTAFYSAVSAGTQLGEKDAEVGQGLDEVACSAAAGQRRAVQGAQRHRQDVSRASTEPTPRPRTSASASALA